MTVMASGAADGPHLPNTPIIVSSTSCFFGARLCDATVLPASSVGDAAALRCCKGVTPNQRTQALWKLLISRNLSSKPRPFRPVEEWRNRRLRRCGGYRQHVPMVKSFSGLFGHGDKSECQRASIYFYRAYAWQK